MDVIKSCKKIYRDDGFGVSLKKIQFADLAYRVYNGGGIKTPFIMKNRDSATLGFVDPHVLEFVQLRIAAYDLFIPNSFICLAMEENDVLEENNP